MKKKMIVLILGLCTLMHIPSLAQDTRTTVANVPMLQLNNGVFMPQFGLGTFMASVEDCRQACLMALKNGYRHIDTAHAYMNERGVGNAIKESGP